jgi:photosystem II stability/assembly factor-like uncharacterized protein
MTGRRPFAVLFGTILLTAGVARPADDGRWVSIAPDGGAVESLARAADGTLFAGTHNGGLFRRVGEGWSPAGWPLRDTPIRDLAAHPSNPRVVYAATTEGVYWTQDGGARWSEAGNFPAVLVAIAPSDPAVLYAGASRLFKSTDGGEDWSPVGPGLEYAVSLAVDPQDSRIVYAGGTSGVLRSLDGGATWTATGPRTPTGGSYSIHELVADPTRPGTLWAGTTFGGLFKSGDRGATWSLVGPDLGTLLTSALAVDPAGTVWAGFTGFSRDRTGGVFKSPDGGATWTRVLPDHAVQDLVSNPADPDRLYAASERLGVLWSDDGGGTWAEVNEGLRALLVSDLEIDPWAGGRILAVAANSPFGNANVTTVLGGRAGEDLPLLLGRWEDPASAFLTDLALHPDHPDALYAAHEDGILRSLDGGRTWRESSRGLRKREWVAALAIARSDPRVLYAAGWDAYPICEGSRRNCRFTRVYRSDDGGRRWTAPSRPLESERVRMSVLVADPERPSVVYVAGEKLFKSVDGARTWRPLGRGLEGGVRALAVDPGDPDVLYAATYVRGEGTRLFRSGDGGASWTPAADGLPSYRIVSSLATDPRNPGTVYAGTDRGVYVTRNDGRAWAPMNQGLGGLAVPVLDLAVDPRNGILYAGTRGGGGLFMFLPAGR